MGKEVLVVHPYKHHALELAAAIAQSGRPIQLLTPFYRKGLTGLLAWIPLDAGRRAAGYDHAALRASDVYCPFAATMLRFALGGRPAAFRDAFDQLAAHHVSASAGRFEWLVTLQDYMPRTVDAAVRAGVRIWSDQISNQTDEAISRIGAHHRALGLPEPRHDESKNRAILEQAQLVTVPSSYYERALLSRGVSAQKLYKIPYGAFFPPSSTAANVVLRNRDVFRIVARANSIRKGGHLLLCAIKEWSDRWTAALRGKPLHISVLGEFAPSLASMYSGLGALRNIEISHGNIPHAQVGTLYATADLFVMPALSEALSLACLEALSFGLPLVVTPYTGVDDVVGVCGFEVQDNAMSLGAGILEAIESRHLFPAMSARGQELVRDVYNWSRYRGLVKDAMEARM
ncbi:glycosyltransferase involved in cell wall biosynthesis [Paraburkholderia bannensis]|uniref:Glycosyltransferase involved in cell wall biosynthesis n=1 Tax=Paraburkholderia bannensis TaxID=765414 RepID=A0A7W9TTE8_9BURK|nr:MULTISPECIES: glycosyltransferase family 4 protein [Paraburkholderia]MBB3255239.1 glycosyltransferase involved in cell wall biosynthesis [Paraburkholderia sp. WP4_3_2]MBB6100749.1 glycosyltransferase involved in cell wall biosynthesis [Paraburkholderia bannensis]